MKNSLARLGVSIFRLFCLLVLISCPLLAQTFSSTGNMTTERYAMSVTTLQNGMILIAGGQGPGSGTLASAELYNPATGTFTATGSLIHARYLHTATLLNNGMVLIVGGFSSGDVRDDSELYNPATGEFTATGSLITARVWHTANVITTGANAGNVVVIGGQSGSGGTLSSAEIYNVSTGTFTAAGNLTHARFGHTATTLQNGKILVVGGFSSGNTRSVAELFDPTLDTFTDTGSTLVPTAYHTATLLLNGQVLIAGGNEGNGSNYITMGEIYNPTTGAFTATGNFVSPRQSPATAMLNDGTVLMAGGYKSGYLATAEVYNPSTNAWTATGSMANAREQEYLVAAPVLGNVDNVLVAGGRNTTGDLQSAELYKGPPTYAGFVNPKYVVLSVQYSPPGMKSTVDYGTTTTLGTSSSLMNSFVSSDMVTVTLGLMSPKGTPGQGVNPVTGMFSESFSNTWTEEQDTSSSIAFNKTSGNDIIVTGPATNGVGLDHTNDKIAIWLNPVASYQITGSRVNLSSYYFDTTDNVVDDFDVVTLSVAQCQNPSLITDNYQLNQLMRAWAKDESDGSLPGITAQDLLNIVKADPYSTPGYSLGTGTCSTDNRYCLDSNISSDIQYASPQEGGQGNTVVYTEGFTNTITQGQSAKDTHASSFAVDAGVTFLGVFSTEVKTMNTYTYTNQWSTATSTMTGQSIKTTIVPPGYTDNYTGPTEFQVYQDNVYGTLMFSPVIFDGFILGATPASQSILAGAKTTYTISTPIQGTFSGSLNLSVCGLPTGATHTLSANPISAGGTSTLTVTTAASTPAGTYTLTISAVYGTDLPHTDQVTLVVGADPDFSIAAAPSSQTVTVGSNNTYTVSTTALNGFTGNVTLSSSNVPAGVTVNYGTNPISGTGTRRSRSPPVPPRRPVATP